MKRRVFPGLVFTVQCLPNRKVGFVTFFYDFQMHYACIFLMFMNAFICLNTTVFAFIYVYYACLFVMNHDYHL